MDIVIRGIAQPFNFILIFVKNIVVLSGFGNIALRFFGNGLCVFRVGIFRDFVRIYRNGFFIRFCFILGNERKIIIVVGFIVRARFNRRNLHGKRLFDSLAKPLDNLFEDMLVEGKIRDTQPRVLA